MTTPADLLVERIRREGAIPFDAFVDTALYGNAGPDLIYRFQRVSPMEVSPHDTKVVYYGSQYVHRTRDGGSVLRKCSGLDFVTIEAADHRFTGYAKDDPAEGFNGYIARNEGNFVVAPHQNQRETRGERGESHHRQLRIFFQLTRHCSARINCSSSVVGFYEDFSLTLRRSLPCRLRSGRRNGRAGDFHCRVPLQKLWVWIRCG
jgi:hypothetical protein